MSHFAFQVCYILFHSVSLGFILDNLNLKNKTKDGFLRDKKFMPVPAYRIEPLAKYHQN